jgi:hypothetical protein
MDLKIIESLTKNSVKRKRLKEENTSSSQEISKTMILPELLKKIFQYNNAYTSQQKDKSSYLMLMRITMK